MRIFFLSSLAALAVPGLCVLSVHESDSPHVLQLGLRRNHHDDPVGRDRKRWKRQTVDVGLYGDSVRWSSRSLFIILMTCRWAAISTRRISR